MIPTDKEIAWKVIPGWPGYKISCQGEMIGPRGHFIKPYKDTHGYLIIRLYKSHKPTRFRVHKLMSRVFLGDKGGSRLLVVNHINGIKTDNRLKNLELVTARENMRHAIQVLGAKRYASGQAHHESKLEEKDILEIRRRHESGERLCDISNDYCVSRTNLSYITRRITWKHV